MSFDTLVSIIWIVLLVVCYIGMKIGEQYVSVKYHDQKIGEPKKKRGGKA